MLEIQIGQRNPAGKEAANDLCNTVAFQTTLEQDFSQRKGGIQDHWYKKKLTRKP